MNHFIKSSVIRIKLIPPELNEYIHKYKKNQEPRANKD